jgi:hypothetical protein
MTICQFRQAFIRLLILAGIFFAGDRFLAWGFGRLILSSKARYSVLYGSRERADLVVLGNSRGVNGFYAPSIERSTHLHTVNLSYNGLSMVLSEALLRDWVDRHGKPEILILEITNLADDSDVIEGLAPYWCFSERLGSIADAEKPFTRRVLLLSHLFAYNGEMFLRILSSLYRSDQDWINHYAITPAIIKKTKELEQIDFRTSKENLAALCRLVTFAKENGIQVRLVVTPYLPDYMVHVRNYSQWIAHIEQTTGLRVWDFAGADTNVNHFADRLHLNDSGAVPLITKMKTDGVFKLLQEYSTAHRGQDHNGF